MCVYTELEEQEGTSHVGSSNEAKAPKRDQRGRWAGPGPEGSSQPIKGFGFFVGMTVTHCNLGRGIV